MFSKFYRIAFLSFTICFITTSASHALILSQTADLNSPSVFLHSQHIEISGFFPDTTITNGENIELSFSFIENQKLIAHNDLELYFWISLDNSEPRADYLANENPFIEFYDLNGSYNLLNISSTGWDQNSLISGIANYDLADDIHFSGFKITFDAVVEPIDQDFLFDKFGVFITSSTDLDVYPSNVPVPAAVWLLGSGLVGLIGLRRKMNR